MFDLQMRRTYLLGQLLPGLPQLYITKSSACARTGPDRGEILDAIALVDMAIEELDRPKPVSIPESGGYEMQIRERPGAEFPAIDVRKPVRREGNVTEG